MSVCPCFFDFATVMVVPDPATFVEFHGLSEDQ